MNSEKIQYLKLFSGKLSTLDAAAMGSWGKMNAQQMVEHLTDTLRIANGKKFQKAELDPERMLKVRSFFLGDKPFRENTTNHLLPEVPYAWENKGMNEAIMEFEKELSEFFNRFESTPEHTSMNPFAGVFNFDEWVTLLHKHFQHHARQFGVE